MIVDRIDKNNNEYRKQKAIASWINHRARSVVSQRVCVTDDVLYCIAVLSNGCGDLVFLLR
jgi:hypothetical protein